MVLAVSYTHLKYRMLTSKDFSGILTQGGTILGTSRQPFKLMRVPDANGLDKVEAMKQTYYKLCLDCLVILGGNGTPVSYTHLAISSVLVSLQMVQVYCFTPVLVQVGGVVIFPSSQ